MRYELGFIGAGNMAEAIARAAIQKGVLSPGAMVASDPSPQRRQVFESLGVAFADDNAQVVAQARQVMLAVKPQSVGFISGALGRLQVDQQVVVSIMAGVRAATIEGLAGQAVRVVRVMPNTPLMAGCGMAGVALGRHAREGDDVLAMKLFGAAGKAVRVDEAQIDGITAVSGSGPAYLFYLAEAMQQAATELGLGEHASLLVEQTLMGAATLLCQSDDPPAELRRKVTSPGGTTEAAIRVMDTRQVKAAVVEAIKAAQSRSLELGAR